MSTTGSIVLSALGALVTICGLWMLVLRFQKLNKPTSQKTVSKAGIIDPLMEALKESLKKVKDQLLAVGLVLVFLGTGIILTAWL